MAEIIVNFVVSKLGDILLKEVQLLGRVGEQVERMQRELMRIRCCLRDADSKRQGDERVKNWLNELRDVAYRIEDAIDMFFLGAEDRHPRSITKRFIHKVNKLYQNPIQMPVLLHKLGTELGDIQKVLDEISKSRIDYGIEPLQGKPSGEEVILPFRRAAYHRVDETEVVGLEADKNNILKLLCREETPRRAVITIVGTGGLGKTTLAQMVYKSARVDFKYHAMLSISQQFNLIDLLRKMIKKYNYSVPENQDVDYYVDKLNDYLSRRRYLIILDDVWNVNLWNQLKEALPDVKNGSRVLMTSRNLDIAKSADPKMKPYELEFLNDRESLDILLKKSLSYQEPDEECPTHLLELAKKLSKKCKGLPLALIVVGGILSTKDQSYTEWERVLRRMDWHSDGKDCMDVLAMSYEDMPYYLKACFLYLAAFPEDYEISATHLIRMWVAEGFIPQEERKTMEEKAEDCLKELFQRSMVQVSRRRINGSIKLCRVHDLLRDLAIHEAKEEKFVTVFSEVQKFNRVTRRASLQFCSPQFFISPNTRSLLWFGQHAPKFSDFRLLKVLELVGVLMSSTRDLEDLNHLKYFGLRDCNFISRHTYFGGTVRGLKNLETLHIRGSEIKAEDLWTISTLRHVLCDSVYGPSTTADLRNLQTLEWVNVNDMWNGMAVPRLDSLQELGIKLIPGNNIENATTSLLATLPYLVSLGISGTYIPMKIAYPHVLPNYQNLQSLYLVGAWSEGVTLEARLFPPNLVKLTLVGSRFKLDPMPELGKLESLKKLQLREYHFRIVDKMICPAGFPVLQDLRVQINQLKELKIAEGVMPKLMYLKTSTYCKLLIPPELQHVVVN